VTESDRRSAGTRLRLETFDEAALVAEVQSSARSILDYAARGGALWDSDPLFVDAIAKRIEHIGEVTKHLTAEADNSHRYEALRGAKAMRDVPAHRYEHLDRTILRALVEADIPPLVGMEIGGR
jgi:uncharacterized protein with HEPN domain